eukprot:jgi/Chrpa1/336/Chrysochromulina_OHIO_Genome00004773-RA
MSCFSSARCGLEHSPSVEPSVFLASASSPSPLLPHTYVAPRDVTRTVNVSPVAINTARSAGGKPRAG